MWETARAIGLGMDAVVDPRVRTGVQPEPDDRPIRQAIVFRFLSCRKRMLAGEARHIASDRAGFLGSHPEATAPRTRLKHCKFKTLKLDTPGGRWTPRGVESGPRSPEARGIHLAHAANGRQEPA